MIDGLEGKVEKDMVIARCLPIWCVRVLMVVCSTTCIQKWYFRDKNQTQTQVTDMGALETSLQVLRPLDSYSFQTTKTESPPNLAMNVDL